jgi:hypothetical protein
MERMNPPKHQVPKHDTDLAKQGFKAPAIPPKVLTQAEMLRNVDEAIIEAQDPRSASAVVAMLKEHPAYKREQLKGDMSAHLWEVVKNLGDADPRKHPQAQSLVSIFVSVLINVDREVNHKIAPKLRDAEIAERYASHHFANMAKHRIGGAK